MRRRDTSDVIASSVAVGADAVSMFAGFLLATWIRFDSGWIPLFHDRVPARLYFMYGWGAGLTTLLSLFLFRALGLYVRPQVGQFTDKIPRLIRALGLSFLLATALAFAVRTEPPFSRLTVAMALGVCAVFVVIERYLLFGWELRLARRSRWRNRVLLLGIDEVAAHLDRALRREPRLRTDVVGFVRTDESSPDPGIAEERILGHIRDLPALLAATPVDQVILTHSRLGHPAMVDLILLCEKNLIVFHMVPDLFRIILGDMNVQLVDDIPLLGVRRWPLDVFWNRVAKRAEDLVGSVIGLVLAAPILAAAAVAIRRTSPGPIFYSQERCGERGRRFMLYKLRTMRVDAESETGPVWAVRDDPRRTKVGAFLRRHNLDELPQLWNVLRGDMSLVGPRPERPAFVEQFKEDISRYMWRHVSKPGLTGWAQVNGLRGDTSIEERIRYDLYYLENWSLAFDFKILLKTGFARENAY